MEAPLEVAPAIRKSFAGRAVSFRDIASHIVVHRTIQKAILSHPAEQAPGPILYGHALGHAEDLPICIVGAGVSGLYTAMILQDLGIKYEILEASDRIGGRIYTYRFNGDEGVRAPVNTPARYDYFDIGAMRYPNIPFMNRVFDLFTRVGIDDLLIDYHLSSDNALKYFNSRPPVTATQVEGEPDYFHVSVANGGTVPDDYLSEGVDRWTEKVYDPFKVLFAGLDGAETVEERQEIFKKAWDKLASQDYLSTRAYMLSPHGLQTATEDKESQLPFNPPSYPESVVEWLESFDTATGLYNQAFVESVLDSLDFGWPHPQFALPPRSQDESEDVGWKCIDGGSDRFIHGMLKKLETQPELNQRVTKIARVGSIMEVTTPSGTRQYSQVISTVPLGCLSAIDTEGCDLLYSQKQAIRALHYDASTKVAVKFAARWWEDPTVMDTGVIKGGQSSTDLPIRTCVYPSYGLSCPEAPGVLLASYTWAQDARRLGGLCQPQDTPSGEQLLELTLDNLEKLHGLPRSRFGPVLGFHAHSWETDPYARGAFALFGPTQFGRPGDSQSLFASMKAPAAGGLFHIAGEATSVHHAWVLGSLNSAWRAVYNALIGRPEERKKLIENWDIPDEETEVHLQQLALLARHRAL